MTAHQPDLRPISRGVVDLFLVVGGDCKQHVCCSSCLRTKSQANTAVVITRLSGNPSILYCDLCGKDLGES